MTALSVATTINPRFDHVTPIEATRSHVTITHRCQIFAELMAVARSGLVDIVLVADDLDLVSLEVIHQVQDIDGGGPKFAAISDVVDERKRLTDLGVPVASPQLSGEELVQWLEDICTRDGVPPSDIDAALTPLELQVLAELDPDVEPKPRRGRRAAPYDPAKDVPPTWREHPDAVRPTDDFGSYPLAIDEVISNVQPVEDTVTGEPNTAVSATAEPLIDHSHQPDNRFNPAGDRPGHITVVWGPKGSPGVTTVAVNMAVEAALVGYRTLLIDADTYGAAVAVHLGLLEDTAAIAQACRAAEHRGLDASGLAEHAQRVTIEGAGLDVITGLTRSERWPQVRAAAWAHILDVARAGWDAVIVDCGFGLEADEELSFDIPAPQRNATTLTAVAQADTVIAVGTGDPVGFVRFMKSLQDLTEITEGRIVPIINKVTSMTSGISPKRQLHSVWERFGPKVPLQQFIAWAPEVTAAALLNGKTLAESAPKAEIRIAIQRLMQACLPCLSHVVNSSSRR